MTSKDQERKALEQIRKIVNALGEGSYIAMAFEGCFEIAEENIRDDFGCSMKQRVDSAEHDVKVLREADRENKETIKFLKEESVKLCEKIQEQQRQLELMSEKSNKGHDDYIKVWNQFRATEDKLEAAQQEIIGLKARLYDLLAPKLADLIAKGE